MAGARDQHMPEIFIKLAHQLLLRLVEADRNALKKELDLFFLVFEHGDVGEHFFVLKHEDSVLHGRRDYAQEFFHFILRLQTRRILHNLMPHFLLHYKRQLQINHSCIHPRQFGLECSRVLVQLGEDEGQFTKNIGINNTPQENPDRAHRSLDRILRLDASAKQYQHGRVERVHVLLEDAEGLVVDAKVVARLVLVER